MDSAASGLNLQTFLDTPFLFHENSPAIYSWATLAKRQSPVRDERNFLPSLRDFIDFI
jgi:hypothetical protein